MEIKFIRKSTGQTLQNLNAQMCSENAFRTFLKSKRERGDLIITFNLGGILFIKDDVEDFLNMLNHYFKTEEVLTYEFTTNDVTIKLSNMETITAIKTKLLYFLIRFLSLSTAFCIDMTEKYTETGNFYHSLIMAYKENTADRPLLRVPTKAKIEKTVTMDDILLTKLDKSAGFDLNMFFNSVNRELV